jgi:hypothetical protein
MHPPLLSPIHVTCYTYLILCVLITWKIGVESRSYSFSIHSFLHSPVIMSLIGHNIFSTQFSDTLNLCCSLSVSDQALHSCKTTGKITVHQRNSPSLRSCDMFGNIVRYGKQLLAPCPKPKLGCHPLSAVCNCLFITKIKNYNRQIWKVK